MIKDKAKWEFDAVRSLIPVGILIYQKQDLSFEYSNIPDGFVAPTKEEIDAEVIQLKAEYDAQEYARNRTSSSGYPSVGDQLDEIYHNGIDSWMAVIKVTKDKYPKG